MTSVNGHQVATPVHGVVVGQQRQTSSSHVNNNNNNADVVSSIALELQQQKKREMEIAAMYAARLRQQQPQTEVQTPSTQPSDVTPTSGNRLPTSSRQQSTSGPVACSPPTTGTPKNATNDGRISGSGGATTGNSIVEMSYSSPGEELVYREMREQREREAELRRYWKEIGVTPLLPVSPVDTAARPDIAQLADEPTNRKQQQLSPHPETVCAAATGSDYVPAQQRRIGSCGVGEDVTSSERRVVDPRRSREPLKPEVIVIQKQNRRSDVDAVDEKRKSSRNAVDEVSSRSSRGLSPCGGNDGVVGSLQGAESSRGAGVDEGGVRSRRSRTEAERIVEREVLEAKQREAELRKLRESMMSAALNAD